MRHRQLFRAVVLGCTFLLTWIATERPAYAFAFIGEGLVNDPNLGYVVPDPYFWTECTNPPKKGAGCTLEVAANDAFLRKLSEPDRAALRLARAAWTVPPELNNNITFGVPSGATKRIGGDIFDLQSILVHELGHAFGLDHPNLADNINDARRRCAASTAGANGNYECSEGADSTFGTFDDLRGDDFDLTLVDRDNNPLNAPAGIIDRTTYFVATAAGAWADAPTREYAAKYLAKPALEAVMVQGILPFEMQRFVTADDWIGLRYLEAGPDGRRVGAFANDDFFFNVTYSDSPTANTDVLVSSASLEEIAFAQPIIQRGGFADVLIKYEIAYADINSMLGGSSGTIISRTDLWFDSTGRIGFADIFIPYSVVEPSSFALLIAGGLLVLLPQARGKFPAVATARVNFPDA